MNLLTGLDKTVNYALSPFFTDFGPEISGEVVQTSFLPTHSHLQISYIPLYLPEF